LLQPATEIDPVIGPLIKAAFELYATRRYSLKALETELYARGLRTKSGKVVHFSHLSLILRNPFYMGLIRLRNRNETYAGIHEPLVSSSTYNSVQLMLSGKRSYLRHQNQCRFRLLVRCEHCGLFVVGERKKGHVYYRCHRKICPVTCIREERFESAIIDMLKRINIAPDEEPIVRDVLNTFRRQESEVSRKLQRDLEDEFQHIQQSIKILLQKFLDDKVSKDVFDTGHTSLLEQRKSCEEKLAKFNTDQSIYEKMCEFTSSLRSLCERFCTGTPDQVRKIVEDVFQSITTNTSIIHPTLNSLMERIANREKTREAWEQLFPFIVNCLAGR
jgi:hypothetical protein